MARMWPRILPEWVEKDSRRSAERKVFSELQNQLNNEWNVFYSRPWYGLSSTGGEIEGEADFIIAHAKYGILFVEVKGGKISYDPLNSKWYTVDRNGIKFKIKDPVEQAKKCRYQFAKRLEMLPSWPSNFHKFRYGVIFTDTVAPSEEVFNLGGHDKSLFCHSNEFSHNLENWIKSRLSSFNEKHLNIELGDLGIEILHSLIADPVTLRTTLASNISNEIEYMDNLFTGAQLSILTSLEKIQKGVITGGAGTGKTFLAIELANRLANQGLETLVLTSSNPLATDISRRLPKLSNLQVSTLSSISELEVKSKRWDALLIDEAQDVFPIMWERIEQLAVAESGKLYAFMDSNQSIYRPPEDLSTQLKAKPFELNLNLRNTKSIAKATEALYSGPLIVAYGAEGEKPICIEIASFDDALEKCISVVRELTTQNNVNLGEIAILVRDKSTKEKVQYRFQKSGFPSTGAPSLSYNTLCIETVPQFKGLESNIVIALCDYELGNSIEMSYVSLSRARSRFYLIGNVDRTKFKNALIQDESIVE